jgi:hypothetical protein
MEGCVMKQSRLLLAGTAALVLAASWGCGGGGGGSSTTNALVAGRTELNKVAAGQEPSSSQKLQSIFDLFLQAIQQDPDSSEAHFGAAVCLAGVVSADVDGSVDDGTSPPVPTPGTIGGGGLPSPPPPPNIGGGSAGGVGGGTGITDGELPPTPPNPPDHVRPIPAHRYMGLIWNLGQGLANPYTLLHMLAPITDLRFGMVPYYGYFEDDAARRQQMLERLTTVAEHLAKVEADPNFSVTLPAGTHRPAVTIGLPEVYLFDAYVQSLRAEVAMSLAYIRDPGSNWRPPLPVVYADGSVDMKMPFWAPAQEDKNGDGKLTPDEYLPPSPFLTLRDAGLLKTAQEAMLAVADRETKGIEGVLARPVDGTFLVPNSPEVADVLREVQKSVVPLVRQAATGPVTFEVPRYEVMPMAGGTGVGVATPTAVRSVRATTHKTRKVFDLNPVAVGGVDGPPPAPEIYPLPEPRMEKVTINVAAWFNNPPPDLKVFAPTLALVDGGWPDYAKSIYPDRTFGGLFPEGIRDDLPF